MNDNFVGTGLIIVGSVLNGLWAYPMKCVKDWRWENIWFLFGLFGLVILPWVVALLTVPGLFTIYARTPSALIVGVLGLGCAWGVGSLLLAWAYLHSVSLWDTPWSLVLRRCWAP